MYVTDGQKQNLLPPSQRGQGHNKYAAVC